ncbi:hypothetical protein [Tenacibaculum maritimum]|uniref:hypothetical protein n=1 Tax=Tenacibaculum maritimum TaxID=107401 RepID=UPI003876B337
MNTKELQYVELPKVEFENWRDCMSTVRDLISVCQSSLLAIDQLRTDKLNDFENSKMIGSCEVNIASILAMTKELLPIYDEIDIIEK